MKLSELAAEILLVLLLVLAAAAAGYHYGKKHADNAWRVKEAARLKAEADALESEIRRGEKASGALQAELLDQQITNDQLTKAFNDYKRRHPIVVARRQVGPAAAAAAAPAGKPQVQCGPVPAGDGLALTHGAVWMWNSALAGRDAPSGTCGLADGSTGACAADSGISLEEAWDNQAVNARICAENRIRHQRLIDFINSKGAAVPAHP